MTTQVECKCISKKETEYFTQLKGETSGSMKKNTLIELSVPYDPSNIFYQMSGGTTVLLNTVNQAAADSFILGKKYMLSIEAVPGE